MGKVDTSLQDQQQKLESSLTGELGKGFQDQQQKLESSLADQLEKVIKGIYHIFFIYNVVHLQAVSRLF